MAEPSLRPDDPEGRASRAEAALEEVLAERNRLWEELHRQRAGEKEAAYYRTLYEQVVLSRSWKITAPLRNTKWFFKQIPELGRRFRRFLLNRPQAPK
jgi:hypothetical protein